MPNHGLMNPKTLSRLLATCLLCTGVGALLAPSGSAARPLARIVDGPSGRSVEREATFRFKSRAATISCRLDGRSYRRCRNSVKYTGLRVGRHRFIVRVRHAGRTVFVRRDWTVVRAKGASAAPKDSAAGEVVPATTDPATNAVAPGARLVFSDEFNGTTLDTAAWSAYDSPGHAGNGLRRPSAFSLDGQGNLVVTAKMVDGTIVSGGMASRLDFEYGRVEFRVKTELDPTGTMSGVVLTWPQNENRGSPEFTENDMYETGPIVNNDNHFSSFIHFGAMNWQAWITHDVDPSQWHTIEMDWQPGLLEIYIDGLLAWSISDRAVIPDVLHHLAIQLDARATRTLTRPVRMLVDYVRIYQ